MRRSSVRRVPAPRFGCRQQSSSKTAIGLSPGAAINIGTISPSVKRDAQWRLATLRRQIREAHCQRARVTRRGGEAATDRECRRQHRQIRLAITHPQLHDRDEARCAQEAPKFVKIFNFSVDVWRHNPETPHT